MAVRELLTDEAAEELGLELVSGAGGLDNVINRPRIQKPGLALAGFLEYIHPGRIQILGKSEFTFLSERTGPERARIVSQLCRQGGSCFVLTSGLRPTPEMVEETDRQDVPLLRTNHSSSATIDHLTRFLEDRLAPRVVIHGVLIDVYGLGCCSSATAAWARASARSTSWSAGIGSWPTTRWRYGGAARRI